MKHLLIAGLLMTAAAPMTTYANPGSSQYGVASNPVTISGESFSVSESAGQLRKIFKLTQPLVIKSLSLTAQGVGNTSQFEVYIDGKRVANPFVPGTDPDVRFDVNVEAYDSIEVVATRGTTRIGAIYAYTDTSRVGLMRPFNGVGGRRNLPDLRMNFSSFGYNSLAGLFSQIWQRGGILDVLSDFCTFEEREKIVHPLRIAAMKAGTKAQVRDGVSSALGSEIDSFIVQMEAAEPWLLSKFESEGLQELVQDMLLLKERLTDMRK
jgi:hypothetical protein